MDSKPFLTIDMLNLKDRDIVELNKFKRDTLDVDNILSSGEDLKYTKMIKSWMDTEIDNPSSSLVKLILSDTYDGVKSQKVIEHFTPVVKRALNQYINDAINSKIQSALNIETAVAPAPEENIQEETENKKNIVTTIKEIEVYGIIKSILRQIVDSSRIAYRDTARYFGILLDDNSRKWGLSGISRRFKKTYYYL